jgi:hypothetical protein
MKTKRYNVMYLGQIMWGNVSHRAALQIVRMYRSRGQLASIELRLNPSSSNRK